VTKLGYCDKTQRLDIVTEQERTLATSARPGPHAARVGAAAFQEGGW